MTEKIVNVTGKELSWEHHMQARKMDIMEELAVTMRRQSQLLAEIRDILKAKTTKTPKKK